ncbi:shikimate dehydrogenase [endosymbiont of Pachyrhynchus infernalis]|uniref:shikimate dehydrogenase n=1 Tax=endosymbiont of Pachyrhynchus infernalis TaxID=1971488 RepID=UPI000DC7284B|nr:shikimate dehydrogenase [endosymbiont of Pachyrhynchus infernalis]BBA84860.1 shikimate dehydrogenase (NADP(+)) [endosymbiont of Pachyrhynchus infernalis]
MNEFVLFGNPVKHSKSYIIHKIFSKQININYKYYNICVENNEFEKKFFNFFSNNGNGANITVPFKEYVVKYCNLLTNRSLISNSVNVIKNNNGNLLGDNTDGLGIIFDLNRLNFINKNYNILLLGAGGSVKSIIPSLYNKVKNINIFNRTYEKALNIKNFFNKKNINNINVIDINYLYINNKFDLIINATSSGIHGNIPELPSFIINDKVKCYDLFYDLNKDTPFIYWCKYNGSKFNSDGLGMLISQAAYSCYIWFGIMPNILLTIKNIKNNLFNIL